MSVHVTSWAWKQKVGDAGAKLLLVKLAEQANDRGECWPSQRRLADECEMSRRTVQRKLEKLYAAGLVAAEQRARTDGGDTSLFYRLGAATPVRQSDAPPLDTGDAPPASRVTHHEPSVEPSSPAEAVERGRPRDEIWDVLEERFGVVAEKTNAHKRRNKAAADLRRHGAGAESIRRALVAWGRHFEGATVTDIALATHYPQLSTAGNVRRLAPAEVCPECEIGGGSHVAGCSLAVRETPEQARRSWVTDAAQTLPPADVAAVIDGWDGVDPVERQELLELAERLATATVDGAEAAA